MSRTFGTAKQIKNSGQYVIDKKATTIFCDKNNCFTSIADQGCYDLLNLSKLLNRPVKYNYNNLDINLVTKLNLAGVPVIKKNSTGACPTSIEAPANPSSETDDYRYTTYTIDPSGNLFGNTECGLANWENYLAPNDP